MLIKYKGNTSILLTELSLEIKNQVDLKFAETVLKYFFYTFLKDSTLEKSIELVTSLPIHLKPFCQKKHATIEIEHELFDSKNIKKTMKVIFKIFEKHLPAEKYPVIYSCVPFNLYLPINQPLIKVCLAA